MEKRKRGRGRPRKEEPRVEQPPEPPKPAAPGPPKIDDLPKPVGLLQAQKNERIFRHQMSAEQWKGRVWRNFGQQWEGTVLPMQDRVEFHTISGIRTARYDLSDIEWERQTGWK